MGGKDKTTSVNFQSSIFVSTYYFSKLLPKYCILPICIFQSHLPAFIFAAGFYPQLFMMKKFFAVAAILLLSTGVALAQETDNKNSTPEKAKPARDAIMLQFGYDAWTNTPDSINTTGFGRGFNAYVMYDFPIQKSHFSFAAGVGIGTSNVYFKNQELSFTDTGALGKMVHFNPETYDYKKSKLTTAYAEAPFELRYFSNKEDRNKGFKAAIGLKAGALVGAHTKTKRTVEGSSVVEKVNTKRYLETWRVGGTVRLGYGNFSIFGTYQLNSVFKEGNGPQVTPFSVGLCISGL